MLGVTPEMAFFFYSFFKLSIFCRSDEKFDGVCQQLQIEHKLLHFEQVTRHRRCGGLLTTIQIDIFHVLAEYSFPDTMTDYIA